MRILQYMCIATLLVATVQAQASKRRHFLAAMIGTLLASQGQACEVFELPIAGTLRGLTVRSSNGSGFTRFLEYGDGSCLLKIDQNDPVIQNIKLNEPVVLGGRLIDGTLTQVVKHESNLRTLPQSSAFTSTTHRVLIVPLHFENKNLECSKDSLNAMIQTNPLSFASYIEGNSDGNIAIETEIIDPTTVSAIDESTCDERTIASVAMVTLRGKGINPNNYRIIFFEFPSGSCPWVGFAYLGSNIAVIRACDSLFVHVHEAGHCYGSGHAGTQGNPYGDPSSPMGNKFFLVNFNLPNREQIATKVANYNQRSITHAKEWGSYLITSLDTYQPNFTDIFGLAFDVGSTRYYFALRSREDILSEQLPSSMANRVHIHHHVPGTFEDSILIGTLGIGESFSINGTTLQVEAIQNTQARVTLRAAIQSAAAQIEASSLVFGAWLAVITMIW